MTGARSVIVRIAWPETLAIVAIGLVAIESSPPARERAAPAAEARVAFEPGATARLRAAFAASAPQPAFPHRDGADELRRP